MALVFAQSLVYTIKEMPTVTISKEKYELLKKQAELYQRVLKSVQAGVFGIEEYSNERIKDFLQQDKIPNNLRSKILKILKTGN